MNTKEMVVEMLQYVRRNDSFNLTSREMNEFEINLLDAVEKATPKEPTIIKLDSKIQIGNVTFNKDCTAYKCQCEKFIKYKQIYCDVCGQHLKWEE